MVAAIWAESADGYIGADGTLPWHLPEDLAHFRRVTAGDVVVMGRRTWESLPDRFRPLPGRHNLVLSSAPGRDLPGARVVGGVDEALAVIAGRAAWVIGGAQVFAAFADRIERIELTQVDLIVGRGVRAPVLDDRWALVAVDPPSGWHTSTTGLRYRHRAFRRAADGETRPRTAPSRR